MCSFYIDKEDDKSLAHYFDEYIKNFSIRVIDDEHV